LNEKWSDRVSTDRIDFCIDFYIDFCCDALQLTINAENINNAEGCYATHRSAY